MRNNQTPPCYDRKNKRDCSRRSSDCHSHCKAWKEYEKARDEDYAAPDYEKDYYRASYIEKATISKLRRQQMQQRYGGQKTYKDN